MTTTFPKDRKRARTGNGCSRRTVRRRRPGERATTEPASGAVTRCSGAPPATRRPSDTRSCPGRRGRRRPPMPLPIAARTCRAGRARLRRVGSRSRRDTAGPKLPRRATGCLRTGTEPPAPPRRMCSLGATDSWSRWPACANSANARSSRRRKPGNQVAPCSTTPKRSPGWRSKTPSKTSAASAISTGAGIPMNVERGLGHLAIASAGRPRAARMFQRIRHEVAATADVKEERTVAILDQPVQRIERRMGKAHRGSRIARDLDRRTAVVERFGRGGQRQTGIVEGHERDGEEPLVGRAELGHPQVVRSYHAGRGGRRRMQLPVGRGRERAPGD